MKYPVSDRDFELEAKLDFVSRIDRLEAKLDFIAFVSRIDRLRDRGAITQAERDALDSAFRLGGKNAAEALFEELRTKTLEDLRGEELDARRRQEKRSARRELEALSNVLKRKGFLDP